MAKNSNNRAMFWRIVRRLLLAHPRRLVVILLALGAGAAITAALLNLQVDAKRRLTTEFSVFGPNVIVAPTSSGNSGASEQTLSEDVLSRLPQRTEAGASVEMDPYLYAVGEISSDAANSAKAVIVGTTGFGARTPAACMVGSAVASRLRLTGMPELHIRMGEEEASCQVTRTLTTGGAEDNEVFVNLKLAQALTSLPQRISLVQLGVSGTPDEVENYIRNLRGQIPDADVHGIRQFTEAEGKIYQRISGLLNATVALILVLTALCVMAGMTNAAMERKNDVGLMKAIGGAKRRVARLFFAEAAVLGLLGGMIGAAGGILLSMWLGKAVFGIAARPRLIVYPVAVCLTMIVAILGAYPLRRVANVRPAAVFRGEA